MLPVKKTRLKLAWLLDKTGDENYTNLLFFLTSGLRCRTSGNFEISETDYLFLHYPMICMSIF